MPGRKRQHDEATITSATDEVETSTKNNNNNNLELVAEFGRQVPTIETVRLEAIFYPKFDNEKRNAQDIRRKMTQLVADRKGYLEVTLKHSGSLLLWSGGQRYYAKNSMNNKFTGTGELVLRQHFLRAYYDDEDDSTSSTAAMAGIERYHECSQYVERHQLTLAFELVTTVLGDHGERPKRDFLILTAVAHRSTEQFYSTSQLVALAHKYRLPHNDCFVFASVDSVDKLFDIYDNLRATGVASTVVPLLHNDSEVHVPSMYPHGDFQGDILEGLVIRYVPNSGIENAVQKVQALADTSLEINRDLIGRPDGYRLVTQHVNEHDMDPLYSVNVRDLYQTESFEESLRDVLSGGSNNNNRAVTRLAPRETDSDVTALLERLAASGDHQTRRVAGVIQQLQDIHATVDLVVYHVLPDTDEHYWLVVVHVFHDASFFKFERNRDADGMKLFRGFVIALGESFINMDDGSEIEDRVASFRMDGNEEANTETLMLKMKFLPYMVRTFGCRNGLVVLKKNGVDAFCRYTHNLLVNWGFPKDVREAWQPFFQAWASYLSSSERKEEVDDRTYLDDFNRFEALWQNGTLHNESQSVSSVAFRGFVVVVAIDKSVANAVSDYLSSNLNSRRMTGLKRMTPEKRVMLNEGGYGTVCSSIVADGSGLLRKLLRNGTSGTTLVMVGCSEQELAATLSATDLSDKESKKLHGMAASWRECKVERILDLPLEGLLLDSENGNTPLNPASPFLLTVVGKLRDVSASLATSDESSALGILVFFPGIPGCGKSSLLDLSVIEHLRTVVGAPERQVIRNVLVREGDKVKERFWPFVQKERVADKTSVYIADKNGPAATWGTIAAVASKSRAVAVPVYFPDAMETTTVKGSRDDEGVLQDDREHVYPFALRFLAVCLCRVLARESGEHAGGLDSSTPRACLIVLMFFGLYRKIEADKFRVKLQNSFLAAGALVAPEGIEVPFFSSHSALELPLDLSTVLEEALQVQMGFANQEQDIKKLPSAYLDGLEERIRQCLRLHHELLLGMSMDLSAARTRFSSHLLEAIAQVDCIDANSLDASDSFVKLAAIDVHFDLIQTFLYSLPRDEKTDSFWKAVFQGSTTPVDSGSPLNRSFKRQTHVTMAHFSDVSQSQTHALFDPVLDCSVALKVTGLLWNDRVAALAVDLPSHTVDGSLLPRPAKPFPHITVWCHDQASAVESNQLPLLLQSGKAESIEFPEPHHEFVGSVSFWKR